MLRQLGLLSQEQEADLSGQQQGNADDGPRDERGWRITANSEREAYLRLWGRADGKLPDGAAQGTASTDRAANRSLESLVRRLSESATRELGGLHDATRDFSVRLGPFSGYQTRARIKNQGMRQESLVVEVRGKEQMAAGLDEEPALTWAIHTASGELDVNGSSPDRATFRAFQKRGWADHARGQDGEVAADWTALLNPDGSASLPMGQILPMLPDVHARYRAFRKEDRVGLHWSRITGATGGPAGRETAVFFSRPDATTQTQPSGGVSAFSGRENAVLDGIQSAIRNPGRTVLDAIKNQVEQWRPKWLGALTLRHLAELGEKYLPQIKQYADVVQQIATDRNTMQEEGGELAGRWQTWAKKNRAQNNAMVSLMHDTTIAGVDLAEALRDRAIRIARLRAHTGRHPGARRQHWREDRFPRAAARVRRPAKQERPARPSASPAARHWGGSRSTTASHRRHDRR
ncbi:hypothetical protein OS176_09080 [Xanthomonadaceae bacterium XH05]|nr:hypothetical protein [Xanthomonadaceae bacterium XH05]